MYTGDWYGLYRERWGEDIVPDAYAHPAKFARGLIRRIYAHLLERGYVQPGDTVVDPFGGVALGGLDAMLNGLHWIGNELEEKFVDLGQQNIEHWIKRYRWLWPDTWGSAVLLQGDSRELGRVIAEAGGLVSSPPFAESLTPGSGEHVDTLPDGFNVKQLSKADRKGWRYSFNNPSNLGNMRATDEGLAAVVSSPPFGAGETRDRAPVQDGEIADCITRAYTQDRQGTTPGNLATMETTGEGLEAVVSSPPYEGSMDHAPGNKAWVEEPTETQARHGNKGYSGQVQKTQDYGTTPGQLGRMKAVVSSPPYRGGGHHSGVFDTWGGEIGETNTPAWSRLAKDSADNGYGQAEGQMEQMGAGDDFWTAARQIVDQCYLLLKPGAVAVWVVKRFVRDKQIVDFPDQWRQMCEAAGFETVEWIRAWVVEEQGEQLDLWGNGHELRTERKSFFRRLYESKYPENAIDWEDVLIMRRAEWTRAEG